MSQPAASPSFSLEELAHWDGQRIAQHWDSVCSALLQRLSTAAAAPSAAQPPEPPTEALRSALRAAPLLLKAVNQPDVLQRWCTAFAPRVLEQLRNDVSGMKTWLQNVGGRGTAAEISLPLERASECLQFFSSSLALLPTPAFHNLACIRAFTLSLFEGLELCFSMVPAFMTPSLADKSSKELIRRTKVLFGEAISRIDSNTVFPPSNSSHYTPQCQELASICHQVLTLCQLDSQLPFLANSLWSALRVLAFTKHKDHLTETFDSSKLVVTLLSKLKYWFDKSLALLQPSSSGETVPRPQEEKDFNMLVSTVRVLLLVLFNCVSVCPQVYLPHIDVITPLILYIRRSLSSALFLLLFTGLSFFCLLFSFVTLKSNVAQYTSDNSQLTPNANKAFQTSIGVGFDPMLRGLLASSLSNEQKETILSTFAIEDGEPRSTALGKFYILFGLAQGLPYTISFFPRLARSLPWLMNGIQECYLYLRSSLNDIFVVLAAFIYALSFNGKFVEVEAFVMDNVFHPHSGCSVLALMLWTFLLSNADDSLQQRHVHFLITAAKEVVDTEEEDELLDRVITAFRYAVPCLRISPLGSLCKQLLERGRQLQQEHDQNFIARVTPFLDVLIPCLQETLPIATTRELLVPIYMLSLSLLKKHNTPRRTLIDVIRCLIVFLQRKDLLHIPTHHPPEIIESIGHLFANELQSNTTGDSTLTCLLIDLSAVVLEFLPVDMLANFLQGFFQLGPAQPQCMPMIAQFVEKCAQVQLPDTKLQERILRSCAGLFHLLFADSRWPVVMQTFQSFCEFLRRSPSLQLDQMAPSECFPLVRNFLNGETIFPPSSSFLSSSTSPSSPEEEEEVLLREARRWKKELEERAEREPEACVERAIRMLRHSFEIVRDASSSSSSGPAKKLNWGRTATELRELSELFASVNRGNVLNAT
ncbi:hypothetical protein QOT17_002706 [Balamuthia mandrillaris]